MKTRIPKKKKNQPTSSGTGAGIAEDALGVRGMRVVGHFENPNKYNESEKMQQRRQRLKQRII